MLFRSWLCIALLRERDHIAIPGNHDWGVLGLLDLATFNDRARIANEWNRAQLTSESRAYLESLPQVIVCDGVTLAHGSPRAPIWEYLFDGMVAKASLAHFDTALCLVGHTHVPVVFRDVPGQRACDASEPEPNAGEQACAAAHCIINPGSVGQPRDRDPRAAYLLLDTATLRYEHRRVPYDVRATQDKMRAAGLPAMLADRLEAGW